MLLSTVAMAQVEQPAQQPAEGQLTVEQCVMGWPEVSANAAQEMRETYGEPDIATTMFLVWEDNGPWAKTIVSRDPVQHDFPMPHEDVLEQVVYYEVPVDKFDDLAAYDGSVIVERTKGTLAARCDKEGANFLALNLAVEIINDQMTVEEARAAYADNIRAFMGGEQPEIMMGLQFEPMTAETAGSPDEAVIEQ